MRVNPLDLAACTCTSGCRPQVLDDFNPQHEHVNRMHEVSYLTVYFQETSLIVFLGCPMLSEVAAYRIQ